jgi:hypothetical protein
VKGKRKADDDDDLAVEYLDGYNNRKAKHQKVDIDKVEIIDLCSD